MSQSASSPSFRPRQDLTGHRFGRLIVIGPAGRDKWKCILWRCRCECGNETTVSTSSLTSDNTRSCGCLLRESLAVMTAPKHGAAVGGELTPEYMTWQGVIARCCRESVGCFDNYGGRGITVCVRWRGSFEAFLADMGPRPSPKHSIDREDNDGGYWCGRPECPECGPAGRTPNCRWADPRTQGRNRRTNRVIEFRGESLTAIEWAERLGVSQQVIYWRLKSGWPIERALTEPARPLRRAGRSDPERPKRP